MQTQQLYSEKYFELTKPWPSASKASLGGLKRVSILKVSKFLAKLLQNSKSCKFCLNEKSFCYSSYLPSSKVHCFLPLFLCHCLCNGLRFFYTSHQRKPYSLVSPNNFRKVRKKLKLNFNWTLRG